MALEFTELLRSFVPLGVGSDSEAVTEETLLGELITPGKRVLEISRGETLTAALAGSGCDVALLTLADFERSGVCAQYDAVVLSDILAYVRDPVGLLQQCRSALSDGGFVVAAMPNFAYGAMRLALLSGAYDEIVREQEANPRLHFFTLNLLEGIFERAGYRIEQTMRRVVPWDGVLNEPRYALLDDVIVKQIQRDPEHATLTYVIRCLPLHQPVEPQVDSRDAKELRRRLEAVEAELQAAIALNGELREAARALHEEFAGVRRRARIAGKLQKELDLALKDLSDAFALRDDLVGRMHSADRALAAISKAQAELEATLCAVREQNKQLVRRAESAEQTAVDLANELLEAAKVEVQQLSDLIDAVQQSRFWRIKRFFLKLRGLFGR